MSGNKNKLIAFNYFGGKFTWLNYLYQHFPNEFTHLIDVFGGSFSVSLNYNQTSVIKTANEINGEITNFFEVLRNNTEELIFLLKITPCSVLEYNNSWEKCDDKIERARRFYVRVRQSFFGLGAQRRNKGWHMAKTKVNAKGGETVSKWNNAIEKLYEIAVVIRENFQITNYDWSDVLDKIDFEGAFFYLDPPYPEETRASKNDYLFEFTTQQHIDLGNRLHNIKGKAMISSYRSDLYDTLYHDWQRIDFPVKRNNIRSGLVQECIWINYELEKYDLFNQ